MRQHVTPHLQPQERGEVWQILLSIVVSVQDEAPELAAHIQNTCGLAEELVSDYEVVIVDNGSHDQTLPVLQELTSNQGLPNLQVFSLAGPVDDLTARWVGVENSLGDVVVCLDWHHGDLAHLEELVRTAQEGYDLIFTRQQIAASRKRHPSQMLYRAFGMATRLSTGIALDTYSTSFIAVSRRIVSYLLQFPDPQIKFRNLAASTGFKRTCLVLPPEPSNSPRINLQQSMARGIKLVTSTSDLPLRMATILSAIGALASILYSVYVLLIWAFKKDIAPGWVSLSMQQSTMFFLISLVLLVMSEYVLEISRKANSGPSYYIAEEFTSSKLKRRERLNIDRESRPSPADHKSSP